jgi:hypothetical protein
MFGFLKKVTKAVVRFVRRLVVRQPRNEYERIVIDALYAAGVQAKRGMA